MARIDPDSDGLIDAWAWRGRECAGREIVAIFRHFFATSLHAALQ